MRITPRVCTSVLFTVVSIISVVTIIKVVTIISVVTIINVVTINNEGERIQAFSESV